MKILVVCQHFYPESFRINDICYSLAEKGFDVTVLTGLPNYPKGKVLKEYKWFKKRNELLQGVKVKRTTLVGRGTSTIRMGINYLSFAFFGSLKALFMKKDFDIVYVYQISPITMAFPAIVMKKRAKIPLIIHCLDQWPVSVTIGGFSKESFLYKVLTKLSVWTYNKADRITISSKSFASYFEKELNMNKEDKKFTYLPSYAEDDYKNIETTNNATFDLVFAGNIGPAQSVETIIETAKYLKDEKDIVFHIVGDGLSRKVCEELAENYKLNNVIFYGFFKVEEMPRFYSLADAFLITMVDNEVVNSTLPAKVQSYMVAGKPILGAISGEVKEVIEDAQCGLCVNSLDVEGLAKIILRAKSDPKSLKKWALNSKEYYEANFEKEKCMKDLIETMEVILYEKKQK